MRVNRVVCVIKIITHFTHADLTVSFSASSFDSSIFGPSLVHRSAFVCDSVIRLLQVCAYWFVQIDLAVAIRHFVWRFSLQTLKSNHQTRPSQAIG